MKYLIRVAPWIVLAVIVNGCSLNHVISDDYAQYLARAKSQVALPTSPLRVDYQLSARTKSHNDDIVSATVGAANNWNVQYGQMLEAQLQSREVQAAFASLQPKGAASVDRSLLFDLVSYRFEDYRAYIEMEVMVTSGGKTAFTKRYKVEGPAQGGKMWMGGAMAMRTAVQQSTKLATDDILKQLLTDLASAPR